MPVGYKWGDQESEAMHSLLPPLPGLQKLGPCRKRKYVWVPQAQHGCLTLGLP